ncbi:MAG TPA: Uma2 family endonuclease [Bacillota bacterium]|nr:Uma2 family endonuclease [Bacillota bacterium]
MDATTNAAVKPWTADEFCRLPDGWRYEIDEGELVIMAPAGYRHGQIVTAVTAILHDFVKHNGLGQVLAGEPGVYLQRQPLETLRAADVLFFSRERASRISNKAGFPEVAPDLAVEVHLPYEPDMQRKVGQYLTAGVQSVWVIDPTRRTLTQHRSGAQPATIADSDAAVTDPALPGFSCPLRELLGD